MSSGHETPSFRPPENIISPEVDNITKQRAFIQSGISYTGIPSLKQGALINANIDGVDQRLVTIVLINGSKKPVDQRYCHQPLINSLIFCVDQHIEICC